MYELWSPTPDSLRLTEYEQDGNRTWQATQVMFAGRIAQRSGPRLKLEGLEGKLANRIPDGWIRIDSSAGHLVLFLASMRLEPVSADPQSLVGTWEVPDNIHTGQGRLQLREDGGWLHINATSTTKTGTWETRTLTKQGLDSAGMEARIATHLGGKECLSLFSSAFLVDRSAGAVWLDQWGDKAILALAPKTP